MHTDILVLFKSLVPAHTRRLKTGKVVRVRQYRNKVNKRPDEDDRTRDMFADDTVAEPRQDLIAEHKRLVDVLESPSHKDDKVEAKKQKEELDEYENDPEKELRAIWDAKGVPKEKQDAMLAAIADKAQPGAKVGPFTMAGGRPAPKVVSVKAR